MTLVSDMTYCKKPVQGILACDLLQKILLILIVLEYFACRKTIDFK